MGEANHQTDHSNTPEHILQSVTRDLKALQQDVVTQLSEDVKRLQQEKARLQSEVDKLQAQQQLLQSGQQALLSRQQLAQQQVWAKQLAQALASHLQAVLVQRVNQQLQSGQGGSHLVGSSTASGLSKEQAHQLVSTLDSTLTHTLNTIRQDLTSYQSSLAQQITRMQTLEHQGEVILEALVNRLSQQLQQEMVRNRAPIAEIPAHQPVSNAAIAPAALPVPASAPPSPAVYGPNGRSPVHPGSTASPVSKAAAAISTPPPPSTAPAAGAGSPASPSPAAPRSSRSTGLTPFQTGLIMILLSTIALSLHNVVVQVIGMKTSIFGIFNLGGFIRLGNLGNSLLILWMRMLVVVPVMFLVSRLLYPPTWRDIRHFLESRDRRLLRSVVGSGFFLFLSQVLIYIAISQVGPGVAVTILFMYPILTVPLAWFLFGDRPTTLRLGVMVAILSGVFLTAYPRIVATNLNTDTNVPLGVMTAILSGIAFALYLIAMQISFRKLHPVPVSVIQFSTIFFLATLSLLLPLGPKGEPGGFWGFVLGGIILGSLTLVGYLLNNFGVRFMGAANASIIASSGPVLTALLAFLITRTALTPIQWFGIVIVTLSVTALSFERKILQGRAARASK